MSAGKDSKDAPSHGRTQLEEILNRFEDAWRAGQRPTIEEFLPSGQEPTRQAVLIELVHTELELRWKAGERVQVEVYLERYPELVSLGEVVLDLIAAEYDLRRQREPGLSVEEYVLRFPQHAERLRSRLQSPPPRRRRLPIRLNCPHCQNPIQIVDEGMEDITCLSCGSTFRLDPDRTTSWSPEKLPKLGKFELLEAVGRGGFGTVYRARDTELDRTVAVKLPRSGQFATAADEDRFVREARSAARLRHPGIVAIHEVGRSDSLPYIVSEFVEGITLASAMTGRRFSFREAAELVADVAEALDHAHGQGVVHRDLKPSNIMLQVGRQSAEGSRAAKLSGEGELMVPRLPTADSRLPGVSIRPRIMDFGLARRDEGEITVTIDGQILGTPAYMSPEQASGQSHRVDGRSDVYSLGVILYQLLVGELPFRGNREMLLYQVRYEEPRALRSVNNRIPRDLETITLKCIQKEPARRYQSAADLAADLRRWLGGEPIWARPVSQAERRCAGADAIRH